MRFNNFPELPQDETAINIRRIALYAHERQRYYRERTTKQVAAGLFSVCVAVGAYEMVTGDSPLDKTVRIGLMGAAAVPSIQTFRSSRARQQYAFDRAEEVVNSANPNITTFEVPTEAEGLPRLLETDEQ